MELAFLELWSPTSRRPSRRLAAADAKAIDVVPLFLGMGGHLREDLPPLLEELREAHPQVRRASRAVGETAVSSSSWPNACGNPELPGASIDAPA